MPRVKKKKKRVEDPMIRRAELLGVDGLRPVPQEDPPVPELIRVPPEMVEDTRETVLPWLYGIEAWSRGAIDIDGLLDMCKKQDSQLWIGVVDGSPVGSFVTEIREYPLTRSVCIWCIGGDVRAMMKTHVEIDRFARAEGATRVQVECPRWGEKLVNEGLLGEDMRPVRALLERDLYTEK